MLQNYSLKDALNDTKDRIKEFSKYLLISFYFQQTNQDSSDTALEFFHNSLWEFLTAEYMWEENKNLLLKKDRYDELETIRKEDYFSFLDKLSGQKKINEFYVAKNLVEIISNEEEITKRQIFNQSIEVFYELLNNDFLLNFNFEKEGLTCVEKALEHFNIFWSFLHESNINNSINIFQKGFQYLFQENRFISERLNNVCITDSSLFNVFFIESTLNDVRFSNSSLILEIDDSHFERVNFDNCYFSRSLFDHNKFYNVKFIDCEFSYYVNFKDNIFKDLIINNVAINEREWFDDFLEDNYFDSSFLERHFVEERIEENHNGEDGISFYIMCKDIETTFEELYAAGQQPGADAGAQNAGGNNAGGADDVQDADFEEVK